MPFMDLYGMSWQIAVSSWWPTGVGVLRKGASHVGRLESNAVGEHSGDDWTDPK